MLVYDWMWWGQLTNQNLVWRGVQRCTEGAQRCMEGCVEVRRGAWRCAEGYVEVHGGVHGGAQRGACRWLPLATIDLVGDNREFEV